MRWPLVLLALASPASAGKGGRAPKTLGGSAIVVTTKHDRTIEHVDVTIMTIALRGSGDEVMSVPIASTYDYPEPEADRIGSYAYDVTWKDLDDDGTPELVLDLGKTTGDGAIDREKRRIFELHDGRFVETGVRPCTIAADDHVKLNEPVPVARRITAITRFLDSVELNDPDDVVLCAAVDAFAAAGVTAPLPRPATAAVAPIAPSCPGVDWAERHDEAVPIQRAGVYLARDGTLERFVAQDDRLAVEPVTVEKWRNEDEVPVVVNRIETWVADQALLVFAAVPGVGDVLYELGFDVTTVLRSSRVDEDEIPEIELVDNVLRLTGGIWTREVITAWQP